VREAPEKGKANEKVRELIAEQLKVALNRVRILRGETSKLKFIEVVE
jgi:uncharacterized protein YggU (UPF0235/DUF167 family)